MLDKKWLGMTIVGAAGHNSDGFLLYFFYSKLHSSPFAEVPFHLLIVSQLSGKNPFWVPSRESNSGLPSHDQLNYAAP
jgi:hypothetical protein